MERMLLKNGAGINEVGKDGLMELHRAARDGLGGVVKELIMKGAPVDLKDKDRRRVALQWAAENGEVGVVRLLLENEADINIRDIDGSTALHLAAKMDT